MLVSGSSGEESTISLLQPGSNAWEQIPEATQHGNK